MVREKSFAHGLMNLLVKLECDLSHFYLHLFFNLFVLLLFEVLEGDSLFFIFISHRSQVLAKSLQLVFFFFELFLEVVLLRRVFPKLLFHFIVLISHFFATLLELDLYSFILFLFDRCALFCKFRDSSTSSIKCWSVLIELRLLFVINYSASPSILLRLLATAWFFVAAIPLWLLALRCLLMLWRPFLSLFKKLKKQASFLLFLRILLHVSL